MANESTVPAGTQPQKSGWLKWLMIGCLVFVLLGVLVSVGCFVAIRYFIHKAPEIAVEYAENRIMERLPEDAVDRETLREVFGQAVDAAKAGRISQEEIQTFTVLINKADSDGELSKSEVETIIQYVKAASKDKSDAPEPR
ncbi:hypothetical protein JXA40_12675 [bacterium]|nr:hypothetical protein [candidate division CSSED10-310 bacterium]